MWICGREGTLNMAAGSVISLDMMETSLGISQKSKVGYDLAIPLLAHTKDSKISIEKTTCLSVFTMFFTIDKL